MVQGKNEMAKDLMFESKSVSREAETLKIMTINEIAKGFKCYWLKL